jgi:hypothetical protein
MKTANVVSRLILLISLILLPVLPIIAQVDFSGNWELNRSKSKLDGKDTSYPGKRIIHINQNSTLFRMSETYIQEGNPDFNTSEDSLIIGSENTTDRFGYTEKTSVKWSPDKKAARHNGYRCFFKGQE